MDDVVPLAEGDVALAEDVVALAEGDVALAEGDVALASLVSSRSVLSHLVSSQYLAHLRVFE